MKLTKKLNPHVKTSIDYELLDPSGECVKHVFGAHNSYKKLQMYGRESFIIKMTTNFFNKGNSFFHSPGNNLNECTHFHLVKHALQDHITHVKGT